MVNASGAKRYPKSITSISELLILINTPIIVIMDVARTDFNKTINVATARTPPISFKLPILHKKPTPIGVITINNPIINAM